MYYNFQTIPYFVSSPVCSNEHKEEIIIHQRQNVVQGFKIDIRKMFTQKQFEISMMHI